MCELVIYDEEISFYETEIAMERCSYEIDLVCDLLYCESANDKSDNNKFKKMIDSIIGVFKSFFQKCRKYSKEAIDKITGRITDSFKTHGLNDVLKNFDDAIKGAEKAGVKSVEFMDVSALKKLLKDEADDLEKEIKKFSKAYVAHGNPKDAEKMVSNIKSIGDKYDKEIKKIQSNPKKYSIKDAKTIADEIRDLNNGNNEFTKIIERYQNICDETEKLVLSALSSLQKYSEDTGYVQNAKSLKDMIHNSLIRIQSHASDISTGILKTGIPFILNFKKWGKFLIDNTKMGWKKGIEAADEHLKTGKQIDIRFGAKDIVLPVDNKLDVEIASKTASVSGAISNATIRSARKVSRTSDIKKWKDSKSSDALSFDNRALSKEEQEAARKKTVASAAKDIAVDAAISLGTGAIIKSIKKGKEKSDD